MCNFKSYQNSVAVVLGNNYNLCNNNSEQKHVDLEILPLSDIELQNNVILLDASNIKMQI